MDDGTVHTYRYIGAQDSLNDTPVVLMRADFQARVRRLANVLIKLGIREGDRYRASLSLPG